MLGCVELWLVVEQRAGELNLGSRAPERALARANDDGDLARVIHAQVIARFLQGCTVGAPDAVETCFVFLSWSSPQYLWSESAQSCSKVGLKLGQS